MTQKITMRDAYKRVLLSGHALEYKDISLCSIDDYCPRPGSSKSYKFGWQVDCNNSRLINKVKHTSEYGYTYIHTSLDQAISDFLKIRRILYGGEINQFEQSNTGMSKMSSLSEDSV